MFQWSEYQWLGNDWWCSDDVDDDDGDHDDETVVNYDDDTCWGSSWECDDNDAGVSDKEKIWNRRKSQLLSIRFVCNLFCANNFNHFNIFLFSRVTKILYFI